eukprot:TRINITY_DN60305_c0_g1_i1.p1 TRINITY_DN60305_c0_g1~~TRINITY_DN60305_c0_g1_i1.p1  ORF type:complete len:403 (+),score=87.67 TRINITY_DN60305_c0_g1_i1:89-1297(+)
MPSLAPRPPTRSETSSRSRRRPGTAPQRRVFAAVPPEGAQRNTTLSAPAPLEWRPRPASGGTIRRRNRAPPPPPGSVWTPVPLPPFPGPAKSTAVQGLCAEEHSELHARRHYGAEAERPRIPVPECKMCSYVTNELSAFDYRQKHRVALTSGPRPEGIMLLRRKRMPLQATVRRIFCEEQLRGGALLARLRMLPPERLRQVFRRSMRYRGTIAQTRFCAVVEATLAGQPVDRRESEVLFDLFNFGNEGEVEYCHFFLGLDRLLGPERSSAEGDPLYVLAEGWRVLKREKGVLGSVTPYELELLLTRAEAAGAPSLQMQRIRAALFGGPSFDLTDGGIAFQQLHEHVSQDSLLRHAFLGLHTGPLGERLAQEVADEQQRRRDREFPGGKDRRPRSHSPASSDL